MFWKKLINIWCVVEGHYGLTIPNIIGSVRLNTHMKNYNIEHFFNEVFELNKVLKISYCGDLEELIIGTFKNTDGQKDYYDNLGPIYFTKSIFEKEVSNYQDLIDYFKKEYSIKIEEELYSKDYYTKKWIKLTDEDKLLHDKINKV